jgi:hypothetical protein
MICPNCQKDIQNLKQEFYKKGGKSFLMFLCPFCDFQFKEIHSRFSQGQRLIFIIVGIPVGIFITVLIGVLLDDYIPVDWGPALSIIATVGIVLAAISLRYFASRRSNVKTILGSDYGKYMQPKSNEIEAEPLVPENKDPLMKEIEEKAIKQTKIITNSEKNSKSIFKYLSIAVSVLIVLFLIFKEYKILINYYNESQGSLDRTRYGMINNKAEVIMTFLGYYKSAGKPYPFDLSGSEFDDSFANTIGGEIEKKYFGKALLYKDFIYHSDGKSYTLCFDPKIYNKCWK